MQNAQKVLRIRKHRKKVHNILIDDLYYFFVLDG